MSHSNNKHIVNFIALLKSITPQYGTYSVFNDFLEVSSICFSNQIARELGSYYWSYRMTAKAREKRFDKIEAKYTKSEFKKFSDLIAYLQLAFYLEPFDWLGYVFDDLELHSSETGQFFTPYSLCQFISDILISKESIEEKILEKGFFTVNEPAVGSGALVIPLVEKVTGLGYRSEDTFCVMATDIDKKAVYMSYLQFSLMGIPAVIYHGNSITLETWDTWYTPAFVLNNWGLKLQREIELCSNDKPKFDVISPISHGHLASSITLQQINLF